MIPTHLIGDPDVIWYHRVIRPDLSLITQFECPVPSREDVAIITATITRVLTGGVPVEPHEFRLHVSTSTMRVAGVTLTWMTAAPELAPGVIAGEVLG